MAKLVGMKVTTRPDGTKGYIYNFADSFSKYDKEHAECRGSRVFSEYSKMSFDVNIGDEVDVIYDKGFQDKAVLVDILVVSESKTKNK